MNIKNLIKKGKSNKELLSGTIASLVFRVGGLLSAYIFALAATRLVGVEKYGIFSLSLAVLQIAAISGRLGFDSSIVKFVAQKSISDKPYLVRESYFKGLKITIMGGLIASLLVFFSAGLISEYFFKKIYLTNYFRIISIAILPSVLIYYNAGALRGLKKIRYYSMLINLAPYFISSIFLFVSYFLLFDNKYLLEIIFAASNIFTVVVSFYLWFKNSRIFALEDSNELNSKDLLAVSAPMLFAGTLLMLNGWVDTLLLGALSTTENVSIFNIALKISSVTSIVLFAVNSIANPKFAQITSAEDRDNLQIYVDKTTKMIAYFTIPIVIVIVIFSDLLLGLFGPEFIEGKYALFILCFGQLFNSLCGSGGGLLLMGGFEKINQNILLLTTILNVIINFILIPMYGINGAAISSMISLVLRNIFYVIYVRKKLHIDSFYNPFSQRNYSVSKAS